MKKKIAEIIGKMAAAAAKKTANAASANYCYQAKEPVDIEQRLSKAAAK